MNQFLVGTRFIRFIDKGGALPDTSGTAIVGKRHNNTRHSLYIFITYFLVDSWSVPDDDSSMNDLKTLISSTFLPRCAFPITIPKFCDFFPGLLKTFKNAAGSYHGSQLSHVRCCHEKEWLGNENYFPNSKIIFYKLISGCLF